MPKSFDAAVIQPWARHLGVSARILSEPGTTIKGIDDDEDAPKLTRRILTVYRVADHTVVQVPPALSRGISRAVAALPPQTAVSAERLTGALGPGAVLAEDATYYHYGNPATFRPVRSPEGFQIRTLRRDDRDALAEMEAACSPEAVEAAEVSVDDTIGMACLRGEEIAAVATGFEFLTFMDIGILTHPNFRRQGLGAATVSALARWCMDRGIIPQYRYDTRNTGSRRLALALNLPHYVSEDTIAIDRSK